MVIPRFIRQAKSNHPITIYGSGKQTRDFTDIDDCTKVFDLISGDMTSWENGPLSKLAKTDQLRAFKHAGFWQPMDTLREKNLLQDLWTSGNAPWKTW